jgi:hypothetical protein
LCRLGAARAVVEQGRWLAVVAVLGDDRSGRGVMAVKPRPGGWDASTTARRRREQLGVRER